MRILSIIIIILSSSSQIFVSQHQQGESHVTVSGEKNQQRKNRTSFIQ
jgi:hypothetical protein